MSHKDFLNHYKHCIKIRKRTLELCSISDQLILKIKTFERLRRDFKLKIMRKQFKREHKGEVEPKDKGRRMSSLV